MGAPLLPSGVFGFSRIRPGGRLVHSGSMGSSECALGIVGYIRGGSGAPWWSSCSFGGLGFTPGRPGGLVVY